MGTKCYQKVSRLLGSFLVIDSGAGSRLTNLLDRNSSFKHDSPIQMDLKKEKWINSQIR